MLNDRLEEIWEGLKEASNKSRRSGKWATIDEVNKYSETKASLKSLRELVAKGAAKEKLGNLFKPNYGLSAGGESGINRGGGYEPELPFRNPDDYNENTPDPRKGLEETLGRGLSTLIVGGGSTSGGGGIVGRGIR